MRRAKPRPDYRNLPLIGLCTLLVGGSMLMSASARPGAQESSTQPVIGARARKVLSVDGGRFKDLNANGVLDTLLQLSILLLELGGVSFQVCRRLVRNGLPGFKD